MRNAMTWGGPMLLVAVVVVMASVSVVEAVDVQGTWDAKFRCTGYPSGGRPEPGTGTGTIQITQTGRSLAISVVPLGNFFALEWDDGVHTRKGVIGGGSCPSLTLFLGLFGTVSMVDADGGAMVIDINGGSVTGSSPLKCHVTAKRTSAVDPGLSPCP